MTSAPATPISRSEVVLKWFLRLLGTGSILAIVGVVMPFSTMDRIHQALGLGALPDAPIVPYLARSTSAFYMMFGSLIWYLSLDVRRHRALLVYVGTWMMVFAGILLVTDLTAGLPAHWTWAEAPLVFVYGNLVFWLARRLPRPLN